MREKISVIGKTQVIIEDFNIEEIISKEFKNKIKNMFGKDFDVRFSKINVNLINKKTEENLKAFLSDDEEREKEKDDKSIILEVGRKSHDFTFFHRGEGDYKKNIAVLDTSDEKIMKILLGD